MDVAFFYDSYFVKVVKALLRVNSNGCAAGLSRPFLTTSG